MLKSTIFDTVFTSATLTGEEFLYATLCSILCGFLIALLYRIKNKPSKSFMITLVVLPAAVQMVIMLVNGNVGTGVAVAGAFSLVRFRSAPGKGQEMAVIFVDGKNDSERVLKITVPENLDYEGKFDSVFEKYLSSWTIDEVKTTNMGSLYKITYGVKIRPDVSAKAMMDEIRTGNGNLEVSLSRPVTPREDL